MKEKSLMVSRGQGHALGGEDWKIKSSEVVHADRLGEMNGEHPGVEEGKDGQEGTVGGCIGLDHGRLNFALQATGILF
jgi:hypothetical protein